MTFQRTFTVSVILHAAALLLLSRLAFTLPRPAADIPTDRWVLDLTTSLLTDDSVVGVPHDTPPVRTEPPHHGAPPPGEERVPVATDAGGAQTASAPETAPAGAGADVAPSQTGQPSPAGMNQVAQLNRAFMNTMSMQTIIAKTRQYYSVAEMALKGMVENSLTPEDAVMLEGCKGTVVVTYGKGNGPDSFDIATDNERLQTVLKEKIRWDVVPSPQGYLLPFSKVAFSIGVVRGRIGVGISPR